MHLDADTSRQQVMHRKPDESFTLTYDGQMTDRDSGDEQDAQSISSDSPAISKRHLRALSTITDVEGNRDWFERCISGRSKWHDQEAADSIQTTLMTLTLTNTSDVWVNEPGHDARPLDDRSSRAVWKARTQTLTAIPSNHN